ncbi:MAG: T9SS type A sorting domain-containing protein [Bacteroidota bacterium]
MTLRDIGLSYLCVSILVVAHQADAGLPDSLAKRINHGQIADLPPSVVVGLFNPDPLLDVAQYIDGKLEVYKNLGDGTFEFVWEEKSSGMVERMEWRKRRMLADGIPDIHSWADLYVFYVGGRNEVFPREQILPQNHLPAFKPNGPLLTTLDFQEVWRSQVQLQPVLRMEIDDIDGDGKLDIVYPFVEFSDSNRQFVVYTCVGDDSFVISWDTVIGRAYGPYAISDVDKDGNREIVLLKNGQLVILECSGPGRYKYYTTNISYSAPPFKVLETDIDHDGTAEICLHTSNPNLPPGQDATHIYIAEFAYKDTFTSTMSFNVDIARYYWYTYDMAVGQIDGVGRDEIILGGVPLLEYLWHNGPGWQSRRTGISLQASVNAPMFVNLDADSTLELFVGGIGPGNRGSCYALDYISDTTWSVLWADSSLRNTPLSVNAGMLNGEFIVAGANTVERVSPDTLYTDLNVYELSGNKLGIWRRDTASVQNFHFLDIDNDGITNLITPLISHLIPDHLGVYEYFGTTGIGENEDKVPDRFELYQNYPNPFNASTRIRYHIPNSTHVTLRVFDVLGREVATLVDERMNRGMHHAQWDGANNSSGVYFYRLITDNHIATRKLLLLR